MEPQSAPNRCKVLVVAGSSPDGGAGLQMDLKTAQALGVYAATAVTCVTAQNTLGVSGIENVSDSMLEAQIKAVIEDFEFSVVKIGLVAKPEQFETIRLLLPGKTIILDPVMTAEADSHLFFEGLEAMKSFLKNAELVTPNLNEAEKLSGIAVTDLKSAKQAAEKILSLGARHVLVKTIRKENAVYDLLASGSEAQKIRFKSYKKTFIDKRLHGSGCMLASAIACYLAKGMPLEKSVKLAERFVHKAVVKAERIGKGIYVVMP